MSNQLKIFATDMDGTFLDENRAYDKSRLRDILKEFKKEIIFLCSKRTSTLGFRRTL